MRLIPVLQISDSDLEPKRAKLHLATWNGETDPLDEFFAGKFEEWQSWQTKRNFERDQVISLISLPAANKWLFAGAYDSLGRKSKPNGLFKYKLRQRRATADLVGRLVVEFRRTGRMSYLNADRWEGELKVAELYAERISIGEFPGFVRVNLSKSDLDLVVRHQTASWRSALSSTAGVYVIADTKTGKLYVGSASGAGGFWGRWSVYSKTGDGGNKELRALLKAEGRDRAKYFRFAVLETADTKTGEKEILARESHWKSVLNSKEHGYN